MSMTPLSMAVEISEVGQQEKEGGQYSGHHQFLPFCFLHSPPSFMHWLIHCQSNLSPLNLFLDSSGAHDDLLSL